MSRRLIRCPSCESLFEYDDAAPTTKTAKMDTRAVRVLEALAKAGLRHALTEVSITSGIAAELICSRSRSPVVSAARRRLFLLLYDEYEHTHREIAEVFEVDRSTVTHAIKKERKRR